jgi:hypothetical protein
VFKPGDVAFFKEARKGVKKSSPGAKCQGHFFGVVLGVVPPFQKEPPQDHIVRMLGAAGLVRFDDVADLLGAENGAKLLAAFEMRYHGRTGIPQFLPWYRKAWLWLRSWTKPSAPRLPAALPAVEEGIPPAPVKAVKSGLVDPRGKPVA